MMKITPITIKSNEDTEPSEAQFEAAARAEYMRRCAIMDAISGLFDEPLVFYFYDDGEIVIRKSEEEDNVS
jgi:hypothetical protein